MKSNHRFSVASVKLHPSRLQQISEPPILDTHDQPVRIKDTTNTTQSDNIYKIRIHVYIKGTVQFIYKIKIYCLSKR